MEITFIIAVATLLLAVGIPLFVWLLNRKTHASGLPAPDKKAQEIPKPPEPQSQVPNRFPPGGERPPVPSTKHSEATPGIFISYRRDDSNDVTGRIYDRLAQHFGKQAVFKDVDSIPLGADYRKHLGDSVGQCDVLLSVIGRQWLGGTDGPRRLDNVGDFVRIEIEAALQRGIPVVPVLVQGASMPEPGALPETLQSLVYRNGIPVRPDPDFHGDMDKLIRGIEGYLKKKNG